MCICEMVYLICKHTLKAIRKKAAAERRLFAETHEMKPLAVPRSEFKSITSVRVDTTVSLQNLNNVKLLEASEKK